MRPCSSRFSSSASRAKCARKVEVSTISGPHTTCTIWKRRPMMRERLNTERTSSGVALVATSKSLGRMPSSKSRTAPPTTKAEYPARCSSSHVLRAQRLICSRWMVCLSFGYTTGFASLWVTRSRRPNSFSMYFLIIFLRCAFLPQGNYRPPAARSDVAKGVVRIHRHRMRHALQQRQVVVGIAVEPALVIREARAALREPFVHAAVLAFAEGGRTARLAGEAAIDLLDVGREQVRHAELARDGRGDEAVGGRHDRGEI